MNRIFPVIILLVWVAAAAPAGADVYSWIDADGVRHFSNTPPPDTTAGVTSMEERPYDAAADQARSAADRATLERIRQERIAAQQSAEPADGKGKPPEKAKPGEAAGKTEAEGDDDAKPKKTFAQKQRARDAAHASQGQ